MSEKSVKFLGPYKSADEAFDELRRACAEIVGADPETWPAHGNAGLAIAASLALARSPNPYGWHHAAADAVLADLNQHCGFAGWWGNIEPDTANEITDSITTAIRRASPRALSDGELATLREKAARFDAINTPQVDDFLSAVSNEALHQRERWGAEHDAGKARGDWMNLIVALLGKAVTQGHWEGRKDKLLHHITAAAAALLNWHAAEMGAHNAMRPGVGESS